MAKSSAIKKTSRRGEKVGITFHKGGRYVYSGVPKSVYDEMLEADSEGRYFNKHVRNNYPAKKAR